MSRLAKVGLVIGGYVVACLIASAVVYVWELFTQGPIAQASSGMYAFGDLLLFIGVFGGLALIPTGLAGYFLFREFLQR
jgi:peptidoglycan biosynthesis protein MviN/MurJ (putative lipid II flippase)